MQPSLLSGSNANANAAPSGGSVSAAIGSNSSTQDMFTTLLVAQIKNQNPLEPTDSTQFINQLTQLSQTEALQTLSSQSASNLTMLDSLQVLSLGAQVGSEVMVQASSVTLGSGKVSGSFTLASASAQTALVLTDAAGAQHRIELGTRAPGDVAFQVDPAKLGLPAGSYGLSVETSANETPAIEVAGTLEGVRMGASGNVMLKVANVGDVTPGYVTRFNGRSAS